MLDRMSNSTSRAFSAALLGGGGWGAVRLSRPTAGIRAAPCSSAPTTPAHDTPAVSDRLCRRRATWRPSDTSIERVAQREIGTGEKLVHCGVCTAACTDVCTSRALAAPAAQPTLNHADLARVTRFEMGPSDLSTKEPLPGARPRINAVAECPRPYCPRLRPTPVRRFVWRQPDAALPAPRLVLVLIR